MKQKLGTNMGLFLLFTSMGFFSYPAHAEIYQLEIDDKLFNVQYEIDGDVIAIEIDKETFSLLIATENVKDSLFKIKLPSDLISAENNEFAVLVNGAEVDYDLIETGDSSLTFFIPSFTEEIEIIGTYVVPEFPIAVVLLFIGIAGLIIMLEKFKKLIIK